MSDAKHRHVSRPHLPARRSAARAPEGRAGAHVVTLTEAQASSVATVLAALPDPATLAPGALVVVPAKVAGGGLARSVLSMLGRPKLVARSRRCSALVARGYVGVGAAEDGDDDLAWGYVSS